MEQRSNNYGGFTTLIHDPKEIEQLSARASILLEPGQIEFFKNYHKSLKNLIKKAAKLTSVPNLPKWLASLWYTPPVLEVHTSSELYDMSAVWLRFPIEEGEDIDESEIWNPGINLLSFRNARRTPIPDLLNAVYAITGEINHNGYGLAGRLHHPDRIGDEVAFYETRHNDKAFYRLPEQSVFWEFHGVYYESKEAREKFGLYHFNQGLPYFLNLYFGSLLDKKELQINQDGEIIG